MTEERDSIPPSVYGTPRWIVIGFAVLALATVVSLGIGWSASQRAASAEQALASETRALQQSQDLLGKRLAQAEDTNAQLQGSLNVVTDRMKLTQGELARAHKQAKAIREEASKKLEEMQSQVQSQLANKASTDDLKALSGDVDTTKKDLQMARGEFGTLIARNHEEIEQLRRLGERDYFEFTIQKKGSRQKVGNVMLELRGVNPKKNLFSVALFVDDSRFEKKNRSANEPIYFYTRGARQPLELVVNQVSKDRITGYVSVPKANATATASSGS